MPPVPSPDPISTMAGKIAAKTFGELATRLTNSVLDAVGTPARHVYEAITTNFEPHLNATFIRCTKVKTILNREEPAELLSLYVGLRFRCAEKSYDDFDVIEQINTRKRAVISGTGGGGKTFFMKYLWLSIFENPRGKIPVFVELRKLNEISNDNLLTYIYWTIVNTNANVPEDVFKKAVRRGVFTFLFDGFDEIAVEKRESIAKQILELSINNPESTIVVSSRPDNMFASWQSFSTFTVLPLTQPQVLLLVEKIKYDSATKEKFSKRIEKDLWVRHESFLSSPLLATMMLMTFSQFADIPQKVHLFYEQAFDTLFYKHDAVKELYQRKMHTDLPSDIFRKYFSLFCLVSYYEDAYEFSEDEIKKYIEKGLKIEGASLDTDKFLRDLTESICIMLKDGTKFVFSHRSFQEYFAAYCLDRNLQKHARKIIDKLSLRVADNTIPMLFDMNEDLVETEFVLPYLEKFRVGVGDVRKPDFLARHFELLDTTLSLQFEAKKLCDWSVVSREFETKLSLIRRLYPALFDSLPNKKYHEADDEMLGNAFQGWGGRNRGRSGRHRDREPSGVAITAARSEDGKVSLAVIVTEGDAPNIPSLDWVEQMGYAKFCRDTAIIFLKIRNQVEKKRLAKVKSIDEVLEL